MPILTDVQVRCHNLAIRGSSYAKGDRITVDLSLPSMRALLHEGLIAHIVAAPIEASVDKNEEIKHNDAKHSKGKAVRHGKRNSKSRRVRDTGSPVSEGLSGAESTD